MAQGVYTLKKRVTFVEKSLSECGDGTARPLEVTGATPRDKFDKIAEIYYRVSDAYPVSGTATLDYFGFPLVMSAPTAAPTERALGVVGADSVSLVECQRGFVIEDYPELPVGAGDYLGDSYPIETYYPAATLRTAYFRETNDKERGLFFEVTAGDPLWGGALQVSHNGLTAFGYFYEFSPIDGLPAAITSSHTWTSILNDGINPPVEGLAQVQIGFNDEVAYVLNDPADSIFSPNTKFYLKFYFQFLAGVGMAATVCITTNPIINGLSSPCNYVIRLSSGDLSCPLYFLDQTQTYDVSASISGATDFIHEATEWFPYAKNSPPVPVWDTATGVKL